MSSRRGGGGGERFYTPPAMRMRQQYHHHRNTTNNKSSPLPSVTTTTSSSSSSVLVSDTNLDRFLQHTTPFVPSLFFSKTSMRGWRTSEKESHPFFILGDLWESFKEWSAYGAGVPLVLNGTNSVVQYYVPFLSGIQLYVDPSKSNTRQRRPGEESDADSSRETSSDDSNSEYNTQRRANSNRGDWRTMRATNQSFSRLSIRNNGSTVDENEITNPPGLLIYEYLEQDTPYSREPLSDKIALLASQFPELKTYRSCDLTAASWISVAWYPIYRIPTGPTLQNLDACFLTFHSLSTTFKGTNADWPHAYASNARDLLNTSTPSKLMLPTFGLAYYKFKISVWNANDVNDSQKANSLLHAADNWLRLLQVDHPDFRFFVSRNTFRR